MELCMKSLQWDILPWTWREGRLVPRSGHRRQGLSLSGILFRQRDRLKAGQELVSLRRSDQDIFEGDIAQISSWSCPSTKGSPWTPWLYVFCLDYVFSVTMLLKKLPSWVISMSGDVEPVMRSQLISWLLNDNLQRLSFSSSIKTTMQFEKRSDLQNRGVNQWQLLNSNIQE